MLNFINFFAIKDIIEISLISSFVYYFLLWLKQDTQKNLVLYAYFYIGLFFSSYYYDLSIIYNLILLSSPFIIIFFVIIHQNSLQKNFISLQKTKKPLVTSDLWLNDLISGLLLTISKNKEVICVIEKTDSLYNFIKAPYKLHADINKEFFEIILENQIESDNSFIWLNFRGKIVALNCLWELDIDKDWIQEFEREKKWKSNALFITNKTDSIIIKSNCEKRHFDLVFNGEISENLSGNQLLSALKQLISQDKSYNITHQNKLEKHL